MKRSIVIATLLLAGCTSMPAPDPATPETVCAGLAATAKGLTVVNNVHPFPKVDQDDLLAATAETDRVCHADHPPSWADIASAGFQAAQHVLNRLKEKHP